MSKISLKCKVKKPLTEITIDRMRKDSLRTVCRNSDSERHKNWRKKKKEYVNEYNGESGKKLFYLSSQITLSINSLGKIDKDRSSIGKII